MRPKTHLFAVNDIPMLAPDAPVRVSYEDIAGDDTGRDLSGILHRSVVRYGVATWEFTFTNLTDEEKRYLEQLFPRAPSFLFTCPGRDGGLQEISCYRSHWSLLWRDATRGLWSELKFRISEV